jgi:hypothetical protein
LSFCATSSAASACFARSALANAAFTSGLPDSSASFAFAFLPVAEPSSADDNSFSFSTACT